MSTTEWNQGINGYKYEPQPLPDTPSSSPYESHEFIYQSLSTPARRVTHKLEGYDLRCGTLVGEFAAHLVACGYSPSLIEEFIPSWRNLVAPV